MIPPVGSKWHHKESPRCTYTRVSDKEASEHGKKPGSDRFWSSYDGYYYRTSIDANIVIDTLIIGDE
jgi:hypothetical protein